MKDTINLRDKSNFRTQISPGVYWVPVNTLGKSRYTNSEIEQISKCTMDEKINRINNLYEAVQLLQIGKFEVIEDNYFINDNGYLWEYHRTGKEAINNNGGCCSSLASWIYTLLDNNYVDMKLLLIVALKGSCHVINYISMDNKLYIFDGYGMTNKYNKFIPVESGSLKDFITKKIFTSVLLEVDSIEAYIKFYKRFYIKKKDCFDFFIVNDSIVPPVYFKRSDDLINLYVKSDSKIELISKDINHILDFKYI